MKKKTNNLVSASSPAADLLCLVFNFSPAHRCAPTRRPPSEVQRPAQACDGGAAELLQLLGLWRRLQQPAGEEHPLCAQVLVRRHAATVARSVGPSSSDSYCTPPFLLLCIAATLTLILISDLLEVYCNLFSSSSKSVNRVLVSRVVRTLVQGRCTQAEGHHSSLFSFFSKALLNAR